jgi:hypothetical protein
LNNAAVVYRVTRQTRFPWPWRFDKYVFPLSEDMEITHGQTTSDEAGKFSISFVAIPDSSTDKKFDPVFDYVVSIDITDQGGETRSGQNSLSLGYKALNLQLDVTEPTVIADSLNN